jgi:hypothetical protein
MSYGKNVVLQKVIQYHHELLLSKKNIVCKILNNLGNKQETSSKRWLDREVDGLWRNDGRADKPDVDSGESGYHCSPKSELFLISFSP